MKRMKFDNLDRIFQIQDTTDTMVIIKVTADNPLLIAQFPFVQKNYAYITVTRGEDHNLTVVYEDGHTFSFHWGHSGYTLVDETCDMLHWAVEQFIEESDILLSYDGGKVSSVCIYYNSNFGKWQLTLEVFGGSNGYYWSSTATDAESMIKECQKFVTADWEKGKAITGIDIWNGKNFKLHLK